MFRSLTIVDKTNDHSWTGRKHLCLASKVIFGAHYFENARCISNEAMQRKTQGLELYAYNFDVCQK